MRIKWIKILLFVTCPVWAIPWALCGIVGEAWKQIAEFVDRRYEK